MVWASIFVAIVVSLLGSSFCYASPRTEQAMMARKARACHAKIDPKGLKGAAAKSAWDKCMVNPDNYN